MSDDKFAFPENLLSLVGRSRGRAFCKLAKKLSKTKGNPKAGISSKHLEK